MKAIFRREMQAYFKTPIGYVCLGFILLAAGFYFGMLNIGRQSALIADTIRSLTSVFVLIVPILTMKLMSEERKSRTDQLLLTSPASITGIIGGKYLAACAVFCVAVLVMAAYVVLLSFFGSPPAGESFAVLFGFFLLGCFYISIGLFMSTTSENQVTAALSTFAVLLLLQLAENIAPNLSVPYLSWLPQVIEWLSPVHRFLSFASGLIDFSALLFFLSFSALFLFLSVRLIERRRLSKG